MDVKEVKTALDGITDKVDSAIKQMNGQIVESGEASKAVKSALDSHLSEWAEIKKDFEADIAELQQKTVKQPEPEHKTMGSQFIGSEQFKSWMDGKTQKARLEIKNTIVNSGNDTSRHEQMPGLVPGAFRQLTVMPTVSKGQTSSNVIYFSRELAWTSNAAETAEAASKPESALTFEEVTTNVRTIPHIIKVSKQALDDSAFLSSYIDSRMRHGVNNRMEYQVINGDGTGQNLSGWLATGNNTATAAASTGNIYGLANKMKYEVIAADYSPDYFYMNPADWATVETTQRGTGDAAYVGASGAVTYVNNGLTPLLWGLPVILSNNIPSGTIICKSVDADMFADRMSTTIEMFEQDEDNVQTNLVTVRGEARGAALNFVPAAIRVGTIADIT